MSDAGNAAHPASLVGTWKKLSTESCADKYPATLTFNTGTTFLGTRTPDQGFIVWDAGIYRLEGPGSLVMGTATGSLVTYEVTVHGDRIEVTDADGCHVIYQRAPSNG